jgi:class 3 adenylate cyclase
MAHTWKHDKAEDRITKAIADLKDVEIVDYTRDMSLENIPKNKAYRSDSVHLYIDILNLKDMLGVTDVEGETCHKRTLQFLNLHYRAVHRILSECDALRVDFHNQRLHAVIFKPYDSEANAEAKRVQRAAAISQLIIDVLNETGDQDENIPNAKIRVGIDTGKSLAVNNGRNKGREPLFLGEPANQAAKLSSGGAASGIYISNKARKAIGKEEVANPKTTKLTSSEIKECQDAANLDVDKDSIIEAWKKDLENNPIGSFGFSAHTPPLKTLDISSLTPSNSRRQDLVSLYADIDGFTNYVATYIESNPEDIVRTLHVIRAELDNVLTDDFEGRKIRFIGDCIHGILCEGTAQTTDTKKSVTEATLCAGALRSSFDLAITKLQKNKIEIGELGLAIGIEYGPTSTTRLGIQGSRVRCSVSRAVLASEVEQQRCNGQETAIGPVAYSKATDAVRTLFGSGRKEAGLDYNEAVEALSDNHDETAKAAKTEAYAASTAAIIKSTLTPIRPYSQ